MSQAIEVSVEELLFLDTQLQSVLEGLLVTRDRVIEDKSLSVEDLLQSDSSSLTDIDVATELLRRIQQELHDRGVER
jgi:hypothetical protein